VTEAGGPTTQAGILYQNSIAALYLGRMIDPVSRPARDRVAEVRVEAPTHVDDIVVIFEDGHTAYIEAKENIEQRGEVWEKLWKSLQAQFNSPEFKRGKDRLVLHLGAIQPWVRSLRDLCKRAETSKTFSELERKRLSKAHKDMLAGISTALGVSSDDAGLLPLLRHVDVEILSTKEVVRDVAPHWMPASNIGRSLLFDKLLHMVGAGSTLRRAFDREWVQAELENDGVEILGRKKAEPRRAPFMAADLPRDFVARPEEYDRLVHALLDDKTGAAVGIAAAAALKGAGGYGKTTLATAVWHDPRIRAAFRDGILWVTLGENPGDLTSRVQDLIQALPGERPQFGHTNATAALLAETLKGRKALLVVGSQCNYIEWRQEWTTQRPSQSRPNTKSQGRMGRRQARAPVTPPHRTRSLSQSIG